MASSVSDDPPLNHRNWLNLAFYLINVVITYGVGTMAWVGNGTNQELSEKYQTLVTPNSQAFGIWAIIFISQAIFAICQMLPKFRNTAIVQQGVGYYYVWTCFFQVCWTFAFAYEQIFMAFVFMTHIWASLLAILRSQYRMLPHVSTTTTTDGGALSSVQASKLVDFWIFRFPFSIHFGWLTAATALNANVYAVFQVASAPQQLAVGIVSLAVLHAVSVWSLFGLTTSPNYTVAAVLSWANWWIHVELRHPKSQIFKVFSADSIQGVSFAAAAVSVIIIVQIAIRLALEVKDAMWSKIDLGGDELNSSSNLTAALLEEDHSDNRGTEAPGGGRV